MKRMIWHPEERDQKVNQYLDSMNQEPWLAIGLFFILGISVLALFIILGTF